ncbi:MAG: hypothetical protein K2P84_03125 [Undibacterium sp.]|nr:hypothetical protein [Undibacterium sp.]
MMAITISTNNVTASTINTNNAISSPTQRSPQRPPPPPPSQVPQDTVSLGQTSSADTTYNAAGKVAQNKDLQALLEESNRKAEEIVNLIRPLVEQQGLNLGKVASGEQKLKVDAATVAKARAAVAEDGEFGVKQTADRILKIASNAIGNDPAKIDKIQKAVEKGFAEAKEILGGQLPEVSQQTLKAVQQGFEQFRQQLKAASGLSATT